MGITGTPYVEDDQRRQKLHEDIMGDLAAVKGEIVSVRTPATPDTEFEIRHRLIGRIPTQLYIVRPGVTAGILYASRVSEWNERRVLAKFSGGQDTLLVRVA